MSYRAHLKPILDYLMVIILLIPAIGLGLIIVLAYVLTFQFPIFFTQSRLGINGKEFKMWKFRTLSADLSKSVQQRRFRLGDVLRKTGLDELPQLWNVLKGEMSLIGPRPLPVAYAPLLLEAQKQRYLVLPGITGLAQVNGKNSLPWEKKFEYDLMYIEKVSFGMDVVILFKTFILLMAFKKDVSLTEKPLDAK